MWEGIGLMGLGWDQVRQYLASWTRREQVETTIASENVSLVSDLKKLQSGG